LVGSFYDDNHGFRAKKWDAGRLFVALDWIFKNEWDAGVLIVALVWIFEDE
jgi:hypothetical protein